MELVNSVMTVNFHSRIRGLVDSGHAYLLKSTPKKENVSIVQNIKGDKGLDKAFVHLIRVLICKN